MKKRIFIFLTALLISSLFLSCAFLESFGPTKNFIEVTKKSHKTVAAISETISEEEAYYIGREVASIVLGNYKLYRNPKLESYLNLICMTLVINSDVPEIYNGYHVGILNTDEINAFATSGGHILITRGLLACADSEDALAGVIAHEIGHIQLRHGVKAIRSSRITNSTLTDAGVKDLGRHSESLQFISDASDSIINTMVNSGYSKSQEYQADKFAVKLIAQAGYDPNAMYEMLMKMSKKQEHDSRGFGKTHPSAKSRMKRIKRTVKKLNKNHEGGYNRKVREARYSKFK